MEGVIRTSGQEIRALITSYFFTQRTAFRFLLSGLFLVLCLCGELRAQSSLSALDDVRVTLETGGSSEASEDSLSVSLRFLLLFTVLSLVPSILIMTTSFVRIIIVLSFLRTALTIQQPPNQVLLALAIFLTAFIMAPTWERVYKEAVIPLGAGEMGMEEGINRGLVPVKEFMARYTRDEDLKLFLELSEEQFDVEGAEQLPFHILTPAFMLSELKTAFQMGVLIILPFVVIDMIVASILMSLGMMMLPPPIVSLPLKMLVFVLIDGWGLLVRSTVESFIV